MSKKLGAVFAALLCLTAVFSALSMSTGCTGTQKYRTNTSGELKVNAWVESKLAKPGDTINIYANTSYIDGVSVSADIMEYQHNEDGMASLSLENLSGIIYSVYVTTISLTYDSTEEHWVGTYTIPSSAGGVYVADVTATDGTNTVNDNATVHLQKFYDEHLKPVQDNAEAFLYGEFNDTVNDIEKNLTALNDTVN
ncbi:hypothetical protein FP804_05515, partial [archaeon]|nr:hypothetical protein [archaeon]